MKKKESIVSDNRVSYSGSRSNPMFSEASFFDLIEKPSTVETVYAKPSNQSPIAAFYGLKGGAGRSLCLAYTAVLLARRGLRVATIDFDFEAPGLHTIFNVENKEKGSLAILEDGNYIGRSCDIWSSIHTLTVENSGKVMVMPAGKISKEYLRRLDDLRPLLWNEYEQQPITRLLEQFTKDDFDIILIDCRTGFNGITASMLYHYSDLVVSVFPLSDQIWEGVELLSEAHQKAQSLRQSSPEWFVVPSMVPQGKEGQSLLRAFTEKMGQYFKNRNDDPIAGESENGTAWIMPKGLSYHTGIAVDGHVSLSVSPNGASSMYEEIANQIVMTFDLGKPSLPIQAVDFTGILKEMDVPASEGFAESLAQQEIERLLVPSDDLKKSIDPTMGIIVGSKGSGKTLVWRCCIDNITNLVPKPEGYEYIVGHPPRPELDSSRFSLSRDQLLKLERTGRMEVNGSHEKFWLFYAIFRLCKVQKALTSQLALKLKKELRPVFKLAMEKGDFSTIMLSQEMLDEAEALLLATDAFLQDKNTPRYVLCYDGLDTDFQSGSGNWVERRNRFVKGLLLLISTYRGRLHRILFKVCIREDIYLSIEGLQNKSHMEAYKKELRFSPRDVWRLALNLVYKSSDKFKNFVMTNYPDVNPPWNQDEQRLRDVLDIVWGSRMGKGNKTYSANYIIKRTSDAQGRLFPRTFVQLFREAILEAKKSQVSTDRVLSPQSLTHGVEQASSQRTTDLVTEYGELKAVFDAMKGMRANFDRKYFENHMKAHFKGPDAKAIIANALVQLETIGVLSKSSTEESWSVALMYRSGMGVKGAGLN